METEQSPIEELELRAENLRAVLEVIEMELACVLQEIEKLKERHPIGFVFWKKNI